MGLGLDIGATYDLTDRIVVSAAITDLGFIRWKKDVTNLKANNQFEFSGLNMLDFFNGTKTFDRWLTGDARFSEKCVRCFKH